MSQVGITKMPARPTAQGAEPARKDGSQWRGRAGRGARASGTTPLSSALAPTAWPRRSRLAREGLGVLLIEAAATVGAVPRTAALTLPGFVHDVCSAVHPFAVASPFLKKLPLAEHGMELIQPPLPLAHPLDGGTAAVLCRSIDETALSLGADAARLSPPDGTVRRIRPTRFSPICSGRSSSRATRLAAFRFGLKAFLPASTLARRSFDGEPARALFAGLAAHSILPLE